MKSLQAFSGFTRYCQKFRFAVERNDERASERRLLVGEDISDRLLPLKETDTEILWYLPNVPQ
jgi:hypothetical protein